MSTKGPSVEVVWWRPPHRPARARPPPSPSPGRRRELPRGVELCLLIGPCIASGGPAATQVPGHLRRTGG